MVAHEVKARRMMQRDALTHLRERMFQTNSRCRAAHEIYSGLDKMSSLARAAASLRDFSSLGRIPSVLPPKTISYLGDAASGRICT